MAVRAYTYVRFGIYSSYTFRVGSGAHWWTGSPPDYLLGWTHARWKLTESIDGLEFV